MGRRNQKQLQVQSSASRAQIVDINSWHRPDGSIRHIRNNNIMAGSQLTPVQRAFPNPFLRAGDMSCRRWVADTIVVGATGLCLHTQSDERKERKKKEIAQCTID